MRALAKCSQDTAARDIEDLSRHGILARDPAGGRSTSYSLVASTADALDAVARWVLAHAGTAVTDQLEMASEEEIRARTERIEAIGRGDRAWPGCQVHRRPTRISKPGCESLQELGFYPDGRLVELVAQTIHRGL